MSAQPPVNEPANESVNEPSDKITAKGADEEIKPGFGWTQYAEQTNGRFAMVGFVSLLLLELFTHQDF
ncbi:MAG: chlorophyll a/b-binding protein, partial [Cyanobacteria bacterium J06559_1]